MSKLTSKTEGQQPLSTVHLNVPSSLKNRWVHASQRRGLKLTDYLTDMIARAEAMNVYPIPDATASQYHGAGWALVAIAGGQVVAIRYLRDVAEAIAEQIEEAGGAHASFFVKQWLQTDAAAPVVRELQALGQVSVGMCSAWEFCEL